MKRVRPIYLILPLVSLVLALIAVIAVWPNFDGLYGQDSFAYYDYARGPLDAALRQGVLPPTFFWPPGFPLLTWLVMRLVGATPLAGQVVALLAGAATPILAALLAWELFLTPSPSKLGGTKIADSIGIPLLLPLTTGFLVAMQAQLWQSSVVVMSDTPSLAAGTAGVWLAARWGRTGRLSTLCFAAALMAFAVLTRWAYGLVAIPVTLYMLNRLLQAARVSSEAEGHRDSIRDPIRQTLIAGLVVLLVLLPLWLPAARDLLAGKSGDEVAFAGDLAVYSWSPLNALRRTFSTTDGQLSYRFPNGLYYTLAPAHRYFFTPLLALFLFPGIWRLWHVRSARRLWLTAGWAGIVIAFHAGAPWQNFRFTLVYLPPLAVLTALGIVTVAAWLEQRLPKKRRMAHFFLAGIVFVGLGLMAWRGVELTRFFVERKQADLATVDWVQAQTPPDAQLLAFGLTFTLEQYSERETNHLFYHTPETVAELVATDRPTYLLLEVETFSIQWADHRSGQAFRWLQEERGLVELGQDRQYVLYRVGDGS